MKLDTELISSEIAGDWSYLRPVKYLPLWRRIAEGIAFAVIVSALIYGLLWLASVGAL
ncbi:MAG TPA: hypothetical protein VK578_10325 [Edaphobacter sp.]|nr:hypothetical protein [Edaphobacter sp.]